MLGKNELDIGNGHVLDLIVSAPEFVFGRIYWRGDLGFQERGIVAAYKEPADAELRKNHWRAECCVSQKSFSEFLLTAIGQQLLKSTACEEPLRVNVCFAERTSSRYKDFGQVWQDDD